MEVATLPHFDNVKLSQVQLQYAGRRTGMGQSESIVVGDSSAGGGVGAEIGARGVVSHCG